MHDVVLVSPFNEQLGRFKRFVPRSVPIGIGILAGFLRSKGHSVRIVDNELVDLDRASITEILNGCNRPRVVGISVMTANVASGYRIARLVKSVDKDAVIVFGGIHATVMPDEVLRSGCVDFVVKGEGEYTFLELLNQIKGGNIDKDRLENIGFIEPADGRIVYAKPSERTVNVDDVPIFPYDMYDPTRYNLGFILTSRGCPFDCIFCSQRVITKRRYRYISSERVIAELDYLINTLKQPNITFFDDYFTGNRERVFELCELIKKRGFHKKASFGVQTRGDSIDRPLMKAMREANFGSLMFGVETASENLMLLINKKETVKENVDAIRLGKDMGFAVEATFIFGFPTETFDDRLKALRLAQEIGLDRARFNNATPYPGTAMYEMVRDRLKVEPMWANFSSAGAVTGGLFKRSPLPYVPEGSTDKELEGTVLLANLLFYLNWTNLKNLFNPKQSGSGKWFEVSNKDMKSLKTLIELTLLGGTVFFRVFYYLIASSMCRKFFFKGIRQ
ncbi:MAG: B12-binding domain-containing radical SAM protein [Deltaproteobacteria bacterium]|nr:B12-binding domain-containing radical SAM protein [Deltaproteobacteria bacterium]